MSIWEDRPELVTRLRELAAERNSFEIVSRQLSAEFGLRITKNQALGKAARLGIKKPRPIVTAHTGRKSGWQARHAENKARNRPQSLPDAREASGRGQPTSPPPPPSDEESEGLALLAELAKVTDDVPPDRRRKVADLDDRQCRWPIGDPKNEDFHFCDLTQVAGLPYCWYHANRAFQPPKVRRTTPVARRAQIRVKA